MQLTDKFAEFVRNQNWILQKCITRDMALNFVHQKVNNEQKLINNEHFNINELVLFKKIKIKRTPFDLSYSKDYKNLTEKHIILQIEKRNKLYSQDSFQICDNAEIGHANKVIKAAAAQASLFCLFCK